MGNHSLSRREYAQDNDELGGDALARPGEQALSAKDPEPKDPPTIWPALFRPAGIPYASPRDVGKGV
jgi:hypothetical protein